MSKRERQRNQAQSAEPLAGVVVIPANEADRNQEVTHESLTAPEPPSATSSLGGSPSLPVTVLPDPGIEPRAARAGDFQHGVEKVEAVIVRAADFARAKQIVRDLKTNLTLAARNDLVPERVRASINIADELTALLRVL